MGTIVDTSKGCSTLIMALHCRLALVRSLVRPTLSTRPSFHVQLRSLRQNQRKTHNKDRGGSENPVISYLRRLRWYNLPVAVGFAYISYQAYGHIVKREEQGLRTHVNPEEPTANSWLVTAYTCLPLRIISRLWGRINDIDLPEWLREPILGLYIWAFDCNLEEASVRDLKHYKNLGEFFRRRLRPGARPINKSSLMVSPADGRILHLGTADDDRLEQVKGISYSFQDFAGAPNWFDPPPARTVINPPESMIPVAKHRSSKKFVHCVKQNSDTCLYHCVIYLAPGDYHGYHSPVNWTMKHRRHFPGELLSVNPGVCRLVKGIFNLNERSVYCGKWEHGFFCMAPVGATNVGSIRVYMDQHLETNSRVKYPPGTFFDRIFSRPDTEGIELNKGSPFGEFNLGSTIVLVFEAPKNFKFNVQPGQKVKFGEKLGNLEDVKSINDGA